jgi:hypothetical protein
VTLGEDINTKEKNHGQGSYKGNWKKEKKKRINEPKK